MQCLVCGEARRVTLCRYGANCYRPGCTFRHPDDAERFLCIQAAIQWWNGQLADKEPDKEMQQQQQEHHHHQQLQQVLCGQWEPMADGDKAHHQNNDDDLDKMKDWVKGKVEPWKKGSGDVNKKAADLLENKTDPLADAIKKEGDIRKALEDDLRKAINDIEDTWKHQLNDTAAGLNAQLKTLKAALDKEKVERDTGDNRLGDLIKELQAMLEPYADELRAHALKDLANS